MKMTRDAFLVLTENRMKQRFADAEKKMLDCFQYISSLKIRRRIWQVYISPIIEWFLPVIMTRPNHTLASANAAEVYQHRIQELEKHPLANFPGGPPEFQ